jgi:hypothetical protein
LRKERLSLQSAKEAWEVRVRRETADLELKREIYEKNHGEYGHQNTSNTSE